MLLVLASHWCKEASQSSAARVRICMMTPAICSKGTSKKTKVPADPRRNESIGNRPWPKEEGTTIKDVYKEWKALGQRAHGYRTSVCTRNEAAVNLRESSRKTRGHGQIQPRRGSHLQWALVWVKKRLCPRSVQKVMVMLSMSLP